MPWYFVKYRDIFTFTKVIVIITQKYKLAGWMNSYCMLCLSCYLKNVSVYNYNKIYLEHNTILYPSCMPILM